MMDFELAPRKAAKEVWENIKVYGCNFHFNQALRRKVRSFPRLSVYLMRSQPAKKTLKMFMRLSFLPASSVGKGIQVKLVFRICFGKYNLFFRL